MLVSSLFRSAENVPDPAQILIGVTSFGGDSERMQTDWPNGSLAEYMLVPVSAAVIVEGFESTDSSQIIAAARFVIPYGGLVRGRLAAGETLIVNGATGAYGSAAVLVAAGRNVDKLAAIAAIGGRAVVAVALTGDVVKDGAALREAAGGGAEMAFDMICGAQEPGSTLAALSALRREGRSVLMGSLMVDLPVPYLQLMIRSIEVIGHFMYKPGALQSILALARAGRLDLAAVRPSVFPLQDLHPAMDAAATAGSLEQVVMRT